MSKRRFPGKMHPECGCVTVGEHRRYCNRARCHIETCACPCHLPGGPKPCPDCDPT